MAKARDIPSIENGLLEAIGMLKDVGIEEVLNSSKSTPDNFKQKIFHLKKSLLKYISNLKSIHASNVKYIRLI